MNQNIAPSLEKLPLSPWRNAIGAAELVNQNAGAFVRFQWPNPDDITMDGTVFVVERMTAASFYDRLSENRATEQLKGAQIADYLTLAQSIDENEPGDGYIFVAQDGRQVFPHQN